MVTSGRTSPAPSTPQGLSRPGVAAPLRTPRPPGPKPLSKTCWPTRYTGYRFEKVQGSVSEEWVRSQAPTHVALASVATYMEARELTINPPINQRTRLAVVDPLQGRVKCGRCHRVMSRKVKSYVCQPEATGRDSVTHIHATFVAARSDRLIEAVLEWSELQGNLPGVSRHMSPAEFNLVMTRERVTVWCIPREYTVTVGQ